MKRFAFNERAVLAFCHDAVMLVLSWAITFLLLLSVRGTFPVGWSAELSLVLAVSLPVQAAISTLFGMYQGLWRYASLPDVQRIVASVIAGSVAVALTLSVGGWMQSLEFAHFFVQALLLITLMAGSRISYRSWKEWRLYGNTNENGTPVLVLGAGDAAVGLIKELSRSADWRVMGLLDDDPNKRHRLLHGARVMGSIEELPRIARSLKVKHAIIAMPSVTYPVRRRIIEVCNKARVIVLTVPKFNGISMSPSTPDKAVPPKIRRVAVEDLMKREPIILDDAGLHDLITDKVIMVTGAGGSIGSELCRQIATYQPSMLVLFEQNEFAMYRIEQSLRDAFENLPIASVIGDIKNAKRVNQAMHQYSPSLVFHAAAYKHVPMMEESNAWEAVQNNVLGTLVVARAAIEYGVKKFVLISTDKAVNPTNVMGATKRLSEMLCQALQQTSNTRFEMVRFGNVLGSAGSVIPRFQEQIEHGGPVTVTHPDMVRYFMSIPEAAQLVLQAGTMGLGGEVFVLDMGEPVKIVDLAYDMIRLSEPTDDEIKIVYTGLRPGEKLFEELLADDEHTRPTPHPKLRIAKAREVDATFVDSVSTWLYQERIPDDSDVRRDLKRWVPEYVAQVRPRLKAVSGGEKRSA
ncbi:MAG: polysaccharide biosynthesis protein [Betaproteobacteria bacterium]|nr:polysaccharide biosynthesis protein [Betaproteobacteria bacterium]